MEIFLYIEARLAEEGFIQGPISHSQHLPSITFFLFYLDTFNLASYRVLEQDRSPLGGIADFLLAYADIDLDSDDGSTSPSKPRLNLEHGTQELVIRALDWFCDTIYGELGDLGCETEIWENLGIYVGDPNGNNTATKYGLLEEAREKQFLLENHIRGSFGEFRRILDEISDKETDEDDEGDWASVDQEAADKDERELNKRKEHGRIKRLKRSIRRPVSEDQTGASDFQKEKLLALRSSGKGRFYEAGDQEAWKALGPVSAQDTITTSRALIGPIIGESTLQLVESKDMQLSLMGTTEDTRMQAQGGSGIPPPDMTFCPSLVPELSGQAGDMNSYSETALSNTEMATSLDDMKALKDKIKRLEQKILLQKGAGSKTTWQTVYFLHDRSEQAWATYLDEPTWSIDQNGVAILKARSIIPTVDVYLKNKQGTAPEPFEEDITLTSEDMIAAAKEFIEKQRDFEREFRNFDVRKRISAPYLFWYRYRSPTALDGLMPRSLDMMKLLSCWIDESYGDLYDRVEKQIARKVISSETLQFLVRPDDVIVWKEKKELVGAIARSWPRFVSEPDSSKRSDLFKWTQKTGTEETTPTWTWAAESRDIQCDGTFYYRKSHVQIVLKAESFRTEVPIQELSAIRCTYADDRGLYGRSDRFMVDFATYEELHSDTLSFKRAFPHIDHPECDRMSNQFMESDDPPSAPEIYTFLRSIVAYNLRSKKWTFGRKRLIILLHGGPGTGKTFTAESVAELAEKPLFRLTCGDIGTKPEDVEKYLESVLLLGKSWGCVVLLDKAEVFLEQQRLTDLERNALVSVFLRVLEYYEGILILTSNRVGTFDEAFKSRIQLSLHYENLTEGQRRRIWKNFLNRLKAFEEVLGAATSNGTENTTGQSKIPESMGIDFEDIDCYLPELAKFDMNERQIRNSITTARQLAQFKGEIMTHRHLRHVINVSNKFDTYLKKVQDGLSDDDAARGDGIR
ncbi:Fc.00g070980.m01.CDS01 [Cosmosporella sp. VM-42]